MLLFLLAFFAVQAEPLYLHISGLSEQPKATIQLEGKVQSLMMLPNGEEEWIGVIDAPKHHFWNIHVQNTQKTLFQGILRNHTRHLHLGYDSQNQSLQHYLQKGTRSSTIQHDQTWLWWRGIWFVSIFFLMELLFRMPKKLSNRSSSSSWFTPIFFFALSCIWMGEQLWNTGVSGVHYDALGTYWLADRAPMWDLLYDPYTNWPTGTTYGRLDSFVFFFLSLLLSWLPTSTWLPWFSVVAMTLNGWSASLLAQEIGATKKASWIAGIAFVFHGLTASALIEGHVYHLLLPWLPMCILFAWRTTKTQRTTNNSIYTAICWFLCLLTSAYVGLATTIALFVIWIARKGWTIKATYIGIGIITLLSIGYMALYSSGESLSSGRDAVSMMVGSINLSNFLGFTPQVDRELHAQSLGVLAIPLMLALAAHRYTNKRQDIHILWAVGLVSLSLGLGCFVSFASVTPLFPMPLLWLCELPLFRSIGFPIRLSWPFLLCIGILASLSVSKMRYAHVLVILCITEAFVSIQLNTRQETVSYPLPDVYTNTEEASLELYPFIPSGTQHSDLPMWFSAYSCFFQTLHHHPIAENCVSTVPNSHTRVSIADDVVSRLLANSSTEAWSILKQHTLSSIILYPDLYTQGDYKRLVHALQNSNKQSSTQIWYMERYIAPPDNDMSQQSKAKKIWGHTVLGTAQNTTFRISSSTALSYLTINGQQHLIQKEAVTELYRARCTQTLTSKAEVVLFDKNDNIAWRGSFFPAVSHESLYIDVSSGWKLASPYTIKNPINKEVGEQTQWIWLLILSCGGIAILFRYLYPIEHRITRKKNTHLVS